MLFLLMLTFNLSNSCLDYIYLEIMIVNVRLAANFMITPGYLPLSCCYEQIEFVMRDIYRGSD